LSIEPGGNPNGRPAHHFLRRLIADRNGKIVLITAAATRQSDRRLRPPDRSKPWVPAVIDDSEEAEHAWKRVARLA
jgi:hypothetical protein